MFGDVGQRPGWPFLLALPAATVATAAVGAVIERLIFRRLYQIAELDQVLLTIGVVSMSVATANYVFGSVPVTVPMPPFLERSAEFASSILPSTGCSSSSSAAR